MPYEVTMPQLGMVQDTGRIVAWLKHPGDPVKAGDALFEVETDKATMEVEAQADGFLSNVTAGEGDEVPIGTVIARITDSGGEDAPQNRPDAASVPSPATAQDDLPEGNAVAMPQLGMTQDTGLLLSWRKAPGDPVAASDILFEVETDKSTMEVEAGHDGYLAATLALAGEDVPVGTPVAVISAAPPTAPVARSRAVAREADAPAGAAPDPGSDDGRAAASPVVPADRPAADAAARSAPVTPGRILASPKARRLALERGLDLKRLVEAGHPQPYSVSDLEALAALPVTAAPAGQGIGRRLCAETATDGFADFAAWAAEAAGLTDAAALLSGFAAASLGGPAYVAVEQFGHSRCFAADPLLSASTVTDAAPQLRVRDLRGLRVSEVHMGPEEVPVLTLSNSGAGLSVTLECGPDQLSPGDALTFLVNFAGRLEHPLRHLL